ncbi:lipoprotein-releasing system ATP-binding protein [Allopseudospirillum japonicum]|uniref:Lipoprotein-releasing system ATP-binding protein n=1 Tax=Allopseudospirillum japonicum TaxID=64971 RepID=A0A1H6T6T4_9GAMM|nr:ABC transporter ATP-binding protein [Allopseudospirillum japonicum]SEI75711.1 lipoprotein-releasing system ATP-binding protein [Allopseudospirillum japonicum]
MTSLIKASQITKDYQQGPEHLSILKGINLEVAQGERVAIIGSSGSGKTSLLNILGTLDVATSGELEIAGMVISRLSQTALGRFRNQHLGFVYQFHHLLPEFSALENVRLPLMIAGYQSKQAQEEAYLALEAVGLTARAKHKPAALSGGERQRVAIARALVTRPPCLLLDEPTGNLDQETAQEIQNLLLDISKQSNLSLIVVTHDLKFAQVLDKVYTLSAGVLQAS